MRRRSAVRRTPERRRAPVLSHEPPRASARVTEALLETQNHVLELVARDHPLHQTLTVLLQSIEAQTPDTLSSILLLDRDGIHIRHGAAPSLPAAYIRAIDGEAIGPSAGSCGTAAYHGKAVIAEDITTDPRWEGYREVALAHGLRACWSTPIVDGQQRVLGTFAQYLRKPGRPTQRHRHVVAMTTYTAAIAIVHHRAREEAVRRSAQLQEAQRLAQLGSYEWDVRANQADRSEELCRIFGLRPGEFPPTFEAYLDRVHPADRDRTRAVIERAVRERSPFELEERIVRPDGEIRYLHSQGHWVIDEAGEPLKLVGICHDVTERKHADEERRRAEGLRARNEQLRAFAYMVSHDLKAPLRRIAGYARELNRHRSGLTVRATRCIDEIVAGTGMLDRLIEELLSYSRLDAETPTPTEVDINAVVRDILRDWHGSTSAYHTHVSVDLGVQRVRAWERGLAQILANLISNAVKFSRTAQPPEVRISSEQARDGVRIVVADNGIGFDMKHRDRIFGLFTRLAHSDTFEGTGAGLAIVKKIAEKMDAAVLVDSRPGAGAVFTVKLPASIGGGHA
jgi:PAS domain S-box-containing protein